MIIPHYASLCFCCHRAKKEREFKDQLLVILEQIEGRFGYGDYNDHTKELWEQARAIIKKVKEEAQDKIEDEEIGDPLGCHD